MIKWVIVLVCCLVANLAGAEDIRCDSALREKNVPASTRNKIAKSCEKVNSIISCNKMAEDRKMLGSERKGFLQQCTGHSPARKKSAQ